MKEKKITIGEALAEKKKLQNRLSKCNELLKKSYYYKNKPDFDYKKLQKEIKSLIETIRYLKLHIIGTNLSTNVVYKNRDMSVAELIIRIADVRSQISVLNDLYEPDDYYSSFRRDEDENVQPQIPPEEVEEEISRLNAEKTELDALLQHTNWTKELI